MALTYDSDLGFLFDWGKAKSPEQLLQKISDALNEGDYERAARMLEHFDNGDAGLQKRRRAEAATFRS